MGTEYLLNQPQDIFSAVIHAAVDRGVNYFDAFWAQPFFRDKLGVAMQGIRDRMYVSAHLGGIMEDGQHAKSRDLELSQKFFIDDLTRLGTEYIDVLFLHNCDEQADYDRIFQEGGLLDLARRYQREGKARFIGFSSHNVPIAIQAVQSGAIDVLMFPVNVASYAVPGQPQLLRACIDANVGLVAMKPFGGGSLLRDKSVISLEYFQMGRAETAGAPLQYQKTATITPVQCLAYVLDQPGISTIVPGCKTVEEVEGCQAVWTASAEEKDYRPILPTFAQFATGECVYCNHCLPCPEHIDVGQVMSLFNQAQQEKTDELVKTYRELSTHASDCIACGDCEERCPFDVPVRERMEQAYALFGM
jgi:predicted aldo/keto reductase-like oxidoreductase